MQALLNEATAHRAVNHPYINALLNGDFENMEEVLKDFATQYGYYSDWFPRYLTSVISKLENPIFRDQLLDNLSEERGHLNEDEMEAIRALGIQDEWVQGIAHPQLFKRFQKAIGVESNIKPCIANKWLQQRLASSLLAPAGVSLEASAQPQVLQVTCLPRPRSCLPLDLACLQPQNERHVPFLGTRMASRL